MERYLFFDLGHVPPGLPVLGVPTAQGSVWVELTAAEYRIATDDPEIGQQLATRVREALSARFPTAATPALE